MNVRLGNEKTFARVHVGLGIALGLGAGLAAGAAVFVALRLRDAPCRLSIVTEPAAADVYVAGKHAGVTPVVHDGLAPGAYRVHVAKEGYEKHYQSVELADTRSKRQRLLGREVEPVSLVIRLKPHAFASLKVVSKPDGAMVYVDASFAGTTPLLIDRLKAGRHRVVLRLRDYELWQGEVVLDVGKESKVDRTLVSEVERFYLARLEKEPRHVEHYVDLAHHYVVSGRFAEARKVLGNGCAVVQKWQPSGRGRFYWELCKIATRQYAYPPDTSKETIGAFSRTMLDKAYKANPGDKTVLAWWRRMQRALK